MVWSVVFLLAIPVCNQRLLSTCCLETFGTLSVVCLVSLPPPLIQRETPLAANVVFAEIVVSTLHSCVIDNQCVAEVRRGRE